MPLRKRNPEKAPAHAAAPAHAKPERSGPAHAAPAPARRGPSRLVISLAVTAVAALVVLGLTLLRNAQVDAHAGGTDADSAAETHLSQTQEEALLEEELVVGEYVEGVTESGIAYAGSSTIVDSDALAALEDVVAEYEQAGYVLSIVVRDLEPEDPSEAVSISYHPDDRVYSASSMKGPYCVFVYQVLVPAERLSAQSIAGLVDGCIRYSDNDCYRRIREWTRYMGWSDWCVEAGVEMDEDRIWYFDNHWYADVSAEDFARMWAYAYPFLTSDDPNAQWLADTFTTTTNSAMHAVLGQEYVVWSKAGWYDMWDGNASPATNDAGIVMSDTGPYVMAICTNAPANFDMLIRAVDAVNRCHGELADGNTESLVTAETPQLRM